MTIDELKQYSLIKAEIADLEYRRKQMCSVTDTVQGSYSESPYTLHSIGITGVEDGGVCRRYTNSISRLKVELDKLETYISRIDDSLVRQIIRYKYIDNLTWRNVAQKIGGDNTADSVRKAVRRYLLKHN